MRIFDISVTIFGGMTAWPGDPQVCVERIASIAGGSECNLTRLTMGVHAGTHVDAPRHFIDGAAGVEAIPLESLIGLCRVIEVRDEAVRRSRLEGAGVKEGERILIKTANSFLWRAGAPFYESFVALDEDAAAFLAHKRVALVGIDYCSIEPFHSQPGHPVHRTLLERGVVILEGIDLSEVPEGSYELFCLPLKIEGGDGAPARAVLREI